MTEKKETIQAINYCEKIFNLTKQEDFPGDDCLSCQAHPSGASLVILDSLLIILSNLELAQGKIFTDRVWAKATRDYDDTSHTLADRVSSVLGAYKQNIEENDTSPSHPDFWDCECLEFYIRPVTMPSCPFCHAFKEYSCLSKQTEVYEMFPNTRCK